MGAHRPFCRDCEFNTAGCRAFTYDHDKTMAALSPIPIPAPGVTLVHDGEKWKSADPDYINRLLLEPYERQRMVAGEWLDEVGGDSGDPPARE